MTGHLPYAEQADEAEKLREIADLTNAHVAAERGRIESVAPEDRIYGPGTGLIMAAYAFPTGASRFSDGSAGTYYAARHLETAVAEARYHADRYLLGSGPCMTEKTVIEAELEGPFLDVRHPRPSPAGIYDPYDYRAGQALGTVVRRLRGFGILYDSVRDRHQKPGRNAAWFGRVHIHYPWRSSQRHVGFGRAGRFTVPYYSRSGSADPPLPR